MKILAFLTAILLATLPSRGAYQSLHTFGDAAHAARGPMSGLVDGGDGFYYGVSQYGITVNAGTVFRVRADGSGYAVIYSFAPFFPGPGGGLETYSRLTVANGRLFGTRSASFVGYATNVVYSVATNGGSYTVLHTFGGTGDGHTPGGGLVADGSGTLYGVTPDGGSRGAGVIYKMQTDGTGYALLKDFDYATNSAQGPIGELVLDGNHFLYGVTDAGGSGTNGGTVFRLKIDGSGYLKLHDFNTVAGDGRTPLTGLALSAGGTLYGVTGNGGTNDSGTIFKLNTDGTGYAKLHEFAADYSDVLSPDEPLTVGADGLIYGACQYGGPYYEGGIFKIAPDGSGYSLIYTCGLADNSEAPVGGVLRLASGVLLGEQQGGDPGRGAIYRLQPDGTGFTNVVSFVDAGGDGFQPQSGLTVGTDGFLYGTTFLGGAKLGGTIYKIPAHGTNLTLLHSFRAVLVNDGFGPLAAPVAYPDGFLYGTTSAGGTNGGGILYKIHPDGSGYVHLRDFTGGTNDGGSPQAELVFGGDGNIYGTTVAGGANNLGVIFKISRDGTGFSVLHYFTGGNDGSSPAAALTPGSDGYFYGVTQGGGSLQGGTVFKIRSDGSGFQTLYAFDGYMFSYDGVAPNRALVFGTNGLLYGTTPAGGYSPYLDGLFAGSGVYYGAGTIFCLATNGNNYTQLYSFLYSLGDPSYPQAGLVAAADGTLYGEAQGGGPAQLGEIFKLAEDGSVTTVCSFGNSSLGTKDGAQPQSGLAVGPDGTLYGTTLAGGDNNLGTVFAVNPRVQITAELHARLGGDRPRDVFTANYQGIAGQTVTWQRSTDLHSWTSISTNNIPNGTDGYGSFSDTNAPAARAFYRTFTP